MKRIFRILCLIILMGSFCSSIFSCAGQQVQDQGDKQKTEAEDDPMIDKDTYSTIY